jgi:hypothetical protein
MNNEYLEMTKYQLEKESSKLSAMDLELDIKLGGYINEERKAIAEKKDDINALLYGRNFDGKTERKYYY